MADSDHTTAAYLERLAELLECEPDGPSLCAAALLRNRERDGMRRTIGELRASLQEREQRLVFLGAIWADVATVMVGCPTRMLADPRDTPRTAALGYLDFVDGVDLTCCATQYGEGGPLAVPTGSDGWFHVHQDIASHRLVIDLEPQMRPEPEEGLTSPAQPATIVAHDADDAADDPPEAAARD